MHDTILGLLTLLNSLVAAPLAQAQMAPVSGAAVVPPPNPDADALATQMRLLADNPENLDALIMAGQLATRLGDLAGAEAFFRRADQLGTADPRLLAAKAMLAVRQEHPGQALMLFDQASARGLAMDEYLADRGLAYDLTGDQPRAQRDYKDALKRGASDETARRYALSLGIAGKRDAALAELDPLVRKSDRGAWRVRAFVLAMTGDPKGAEQIADAMLPPAMASGLQRFFTVLPTLSPADKAFAVHFGELRPTPERTADARRAPSLAPLVVPPEPVRAVAAVPTSAPKTRHGRNRIAPAVAAAPVEVAAAPAPLPPPPREEVVTVDTDVPPARDLPPPPVTRPAPVAQMVAVATPKPVDMPPPPKPVPATSPPPVQQPATLTSASPVPLASAPPSPVPAAAAPVAPPGVVAPVVESPKPQPVVTAESRPVTGAPERPSEMVAVTSPTVVAPPVVAVPVQPAPVKVAETPKAKPRSPALDSAQPVRGDDALLSTIVAGLGDHARPTAIVPPPVSADAAKSASRGKAAAANDDCLPAKSGKGVTSAHGKKPQATGCPADKPAKAKKDDPAKKEPARVWVQVAGGANHRDLIKAWDAAKAKAPAAFKGRKGWTTPLRATNRVLAGPFKTRDDAQDFVNSVAKSGISAFVFESEAGQKIDPLDAK